MQKYKITVLDAGTLGSDLSLAPLSEVGDVTVYETSTVEEAKKRLQKAEVAILNKVKVTEDILSAARSLQLICVAATGYDNIDLAACRAHGVAVCNVAGYSTDCVAQLTVTMALTMMTHLPEYTRYVRDGRYTSSGMANCLVPPYHEIAGKTWGILGLGNIGKKVAEVAKALGCRVLACKRTPEPGYTCVGLQELCREADILSVHVPLSESTRGMLGAAEFAAMKKHAVVINVARGAVLDEEAAVQALEDGKIGALCCDVFREEPLSLDSPYQRILQHDRALLTPHMAWGGYETRCRVLSEIVENIKSYRDGGRRSRIQ